MVVVVDVIIKKKSRKNKNNFMKGSGRTINFTYKIVAMLSAIIFCKIIFVISTATLEKKNMAIAIIETLDVRCDGLYYLNGEGSIDYSKGISKLCYLHSFSFCDRYKESQEAETMHSDMCLVKRLVTNGVKSLVIKKILDPQQLNTILQFGVTYISMTLEKAGTILNEMKKKFNGNVGEKRQIEETRYYHRYVNIR